MIPDDQVEEVRARADIVDIIGEYVSLKRGGKDFKARCPFHEEKTPSFYVAPSKGLYKCFGCGEAGDVFGFLMKRAGMSFVDAVKHVAERSGVEIREVTRGRAEEDPHRHLYEANSFARMFFQDTLWNEESGKRAQAYLASRSLDRETSERFGLGYAPDDWRSLREAAAHHGITDETLIEVGLITTSERSKEPYDRFRDRIIFPIEDLGGRVLGFGGRVLDSSREGQPKYVNSPESPIYHKGQMLYGLSWAKNHIRKEDAVLLVEGYTDVVSLGAAGLNNVVAPLGTAVTPEQVTLLGRYSKQAFLLFDSDKAGLKATFRAADLLLQAGLQPKVVTLPPGEDPDTLVHKEGKAALDKLIGQALDILDRKIQILEENDYFSTIEKTRSAVDRLLPTLRSAKDSTLRDIYVARVAERTGVRRETLEEELSRQSPQPIRTRSGPSPRMERQSRPQIPRMGAERQLLLLMVKTRDWVERAGERVGPGDFVDLNHRAIFELLVENPELTGLPEDMEPGAARILEELMADPSELSQAGRVFAESVNRILGRSDEARSAELDRSISAREHEQADDDVVVELLREKERLRRSQIEHGTAGWHTTARRINRKNEDQQDGS